MNPKPDGKVLHSVQWQDNKPPPPPPPEPAPAPEPVVVNNNLTMPTVDARTTIQRGAMQIEAPVTVNTPDVTVHTPDVTVAPAEVRVDAPITVQVPEQKRGSRTTKFLKDDSGVITGKVETENEES
jgi:hypothetical protein